MRDPCKRSAHQPHATELQDSRVERLSIEYYVVNDGISCKCLRITAREQKSSPIDAGALCGDAQIRRAINVRQRLMRLFVRRMFTVQWKRWTTICLLVTRRREATRHRSSVDAGRCGKGVVAARTGRGGGHGSVNMSCLIRLRPDTAAGIDPGFIHSGQPRTRRCSGVNCFSVLGLVVTQALARCCPKSLECLLEALNPPSTTEAVFRTFSSSIVLSLSCTIF